jgi:ABC-type glutathione transport system ATPase component
VPTTAASLVASEARSSGIVPARPARDGTILEARNLTKRYRLGNRDVDALRGVSLKVRAASSWP